MLRKTSTAIVVGLGVAILASGFAEAANKKALSASVRVPVVAGKCTSRPPGLFNDYVSCMAYQVKMGWGSVGSFCTRICPGG